MSSRDTANVLWFNELHREDVNLVGGKSSSLGEMTSSMDVPVPYGFATTARAYRYFMHQTKLNDKVNALLESIKDYENSDELHTTCQQIRDLIISATMPEDLANDIKQAYAELAKKMGQDDPFVAIRSSATAEDLPNASFAGQQESYLNIKGAADVVNRVQQCYSSLFTDRATYYRHKQHFPHEKVALSAAVQMMVFSKASGIMFSVNVANGDASKIVIDAIYGLGEYIVLGKVTPDHFVIDKQSMKIVEKNIIKQPIELMRIPNGGTKEQAVPTELQEQPVLTDNQVIELAGYAKEIERHYGCYMDMEYALDTNTNRLWIVQARPETVWSRRNKEKKTNNAPSDDSDVTADNAEVAVRGLPASPGVASGVVHVIDNPKDIDQFKQGEILVTLMTSPDWVPAMKKAAAIITNNGGMTCHAAIISREMQIPCIVGTRSKNVAATDVLKTGDVVTVDAKNGVVYRGKVESMFKQSAPVNTANGQVVAAETFAPTATGVMMNLGDPDLADRYASLPADGIGLMREEFLWTSYIHEHPLYLIEKGESEKAVNMLAEGIAKVTRAMAPRPVVLRLSDFKSSEYRKLKGGEKYEPHESADLLGWRGASRYYDPKYIAAFKLELAAVKKVRNEFGLKNLNVMIPFVRTVAEAQKVTTIMHNEGLVRNADFKVYMMAEIPANIILADQFNQFIDGYSIGSNDLTMLILGCDRNNDTVASLFDERNLAVKRAIHHLIATAHKDGKTVSICGQAPSEYPDFTNFLIQSGIDYVSVNPDMVKETKRNVAHFEQRIMLDKATGRGLQDQTDYDW
ncbi:phosphoenolpyruvate synthase [Loigolactobacillus coryniformis subsp. coryniformis]|jgi:pyruvate,water dikinase|uniref:Phosphoenolpyruvate synthase n=1 Tax=Loigolactobacillus coryniformis subsp. coryniformis CECT 5711 TaxID=1185325 RepID=J3JAY2_9LACO|nr:phosphoenolpyruvate synthase [Loigolactobacillus coryniformis]MDT3390699.1 phosphoenolpyruvate synthase [Bacillota bacterium]EJN55252.1 Pyruvate,water dikinase [Loigolactobacillus coryniformis subsp. coryniformis CECT 5711]MBW4802519.1 phosphoenolpyruvate synthase [Loigolactobacillus coryniformis subsp. torquens]MBW4805216.1 phosphoenolpyruvate synthase [Loigolactobacillus coryniformis subsp. torquens]MDN5950883.1 phosphoenolpyruvate synthase [Loigolactobacillus coryniformis]